MDCRSNAPWRKQCKLRRLKNLNSKPCPINFFTSFRKTVRIPTDSCENSTAGFQLVPKYRSKVKLISNISDGDEDF